MAGEDAYFNVATLAVKPENVDKVRMNDSRSTSE